MIKLNKVRDEILNDPLTAKGVKVEIIDYNLTQLGSSFD